MNTVEKGDKFEDKAFRLINRLLNNHELGIIPAYCKVFQKKKYYSAARKKDIIFDISIEVWPPHSERFILLYLIECKDYKSPIPVNKIEDFESKIRQVSVHNSKGVFIATNKLQEGGENLCESYGIMLIRYSTGMFCDIVLHRVSSKTVKDRITNYPKISFETYNDPVVRKLIHSSWEKEIEQKLLAAVSKLNPVFSNSSQTTIPVLSRSDIEEIAEKVLSQYNPKVTENGQSILTEPFIEYLKDVFQIKVEHKGLTEKDISGNSILAKCNFREREIIVDRSLVDTDRYLFTLCHELGHYILHGQVRINQDTYESLSDSVLSHRNRKSDLRTDREWLEWQANEFAINLVTPKKTFLIRWGLCLREQGRSLNRRFYLDSQPSNRKDFSIAISLMSAYFRVSKTLIINRLDQFDLIERPKGSGGLTHVSEIV